MRPPRFLTTGNKTQFLSHLDEAKTLQNREGLFVWVNQQSPQAQSIEVDQEWQFRIAIEYTPENTQETAAPQ